MLNINKAGKELNMMLSMVISSFKEEGEVLRYINNINLAKRKNIHMTRILIYAIEAGFIHYNPNATSDNKFIFKSIDGDSVYMNAINMSPVYKRHINRVLKKKDPIFLDYRWNEIDDNEEKKVILPIYIGRRIGR